MEEARKKPKILLLRAAHADPSAEPGSEAWSRLAKALKAFTDFEERAVTSLPGLSELPEGCSHCFVDAALPDARSWVPGPGPQGVTIVESSANARISDPALPVLQLAGFSSGDLLRALHSYLVPSRLAGVAPLMEKGSVILGEKLMDMNNLGLFLDRIAAFFGQVDQFALPERIPDLRQVLSAVLLEAFRASTRTGTLHPAVDFQVSASTAKIAVNLRFAAGGLSASALPAIMVGGGDIHWSQAWQCSDYTMITHHAQHDEIEVLLLIFRADRTPFSLGRSLLFRRLENSPRKGNSLEAPESYTFKLVSEIRAKDTAQLMIASADSESALGDIDLGGLPPEVVNKINQAHAETNALREQLRAKEALLQEAATKSHEATRELNAKRSEVIRAKQQIEAEAQKAERRILELEAKINDLRRVTEKTTERDSSGGGVSADAVKQLESMLRMAENERTQLRESVTNEKRKANMLEQKYSALFRDAAQKDREILELKAAVTKFRKEATTARTKQMEANAAADHGDLATKLREAEEREQQYKLELKKLSFRAEHQEKGSKAAQSEMGEKLRLLEQKFKETKHKEMELARKVEELNNALKKASKAA